MLALLRSLDALERLPPFPSLSFSFRDLFEAIFFSSHAYNERSHASPLSFFVGKLILEGAPLFSFFPKDRSNCLFSFEGRSGNN